MFLFPQSDCGIIILDFEKIAFFDSDHSVSLRIPPHQRDLGRLEGGVFWGLVIPVTRQSGIRKQVRLEGGVFLRGYP